MRLCGLIWGKNNEKNIIPKLWLRFSGDFLIQEQEMVAVTIAGTIVFQPDKFRGLIAFYPNKFRGLIVFYLKNTSYSKDYQYICIVFQNTKIWNTFLNGKSINRCKLGRS